ncbi:hypothetical protein RK21_01246 [Pseudomonas plecoglossicida]|nr:hypothetical protein RK21_01246 [Pseudomonas plecoglossicida]
MQTTFVQPWKMTFTTSAYGSTTQQAMSQPSVEKRCATPIRFASKQATNYRHW